MPRSCGGCTECCKVMGVEGFKSPDSWCQHCEKGVGCRIYADRPGGCIEFECLWLYDEQWPEDVRPDRSHVVMSSTLDGDRLVANVNAHYPNAVVKGRMADLLQRVSQHIDVIVVLGEQRKVLTTSDRMAGVRKLVQVVREQKLAERAEKVEIEFVEGEDEQRR